MLPALHEVSTDLNAADGNQRQFIISTLFLGLGIGQLVFGPISDSTGRKPAIYIGLILFLIGSIMSGLASSMEMMLAGRFLQGVGAGSPRVVSVALIRDRYKGDVMASVMSLIMVIFILVPCVAPALGQVIVSLSHWRVIFAVFAILAVIVATWFWLGQAETLTQENRIPFTLSSIAKGIVEVVTTRRCLGYILAGSAVSGAFTAFLVSSQQIMQEQYALGSSFALWFAALAMSHGVASLINSRMVLRFGMRTMCRWALRAVCVIAAAAVIFSLLRGGDPGFAGFMVFMALAAMCIAILFGNFNALAMEPMGHIAGVAASIVGSFSTLIALGIGAVISALYDGTSLPLIAGYAICGVISMAAMAWTERTAPVHT